MNRLVIATLLVACSSPAVHGPSQPAGTPAKASADDAFAALSQKFLDRFLQLAPTDATQAGEHRYDGTWPDLTAQGDASYHAFLEATRAELAKIPRDQLGEQNRIDAQILDDQTAAILYTLDTLKQRDVDPLYYTNLIGEGLDPLVTRSFGTPASRAASSASPPPSTSWGR